MIDWIVSKIREKIHSLYVGLFVTILFGALLGIATYTVARISSNFVINNYYMSEEHKLDREKAHISALQNYITGNALSSNDMSEISMWARGNKYVYLLLYKDDQLFFTSDMIIPEEGEGSEGDNGGDGDFGDTESGDGQIVTVTVNTAKESVGDEDNSTAESVIKGVITAIDEDGNMTVTDETGSLEIVNVSLMTEDGSIPFAELNDKPKKGDNVILQVSLKREDGVVRAYAAVILGVKKSDNGSHGSQGGNQGGTGITVEYPTREELLEYAKNNDQYVIELSDGMLLASIAEFSEYLYYDLSNIMSLVLAMIVLAFVIVNYFRRIVSRIKRLETDVTIVTHGNMTHKIHSKGYDEISNLSVNVDNMRNSILENLQKEREARDANNELITAMSHDIRTPLTVLLGYIEMMKVKGNDQPIMDEYLAAIERTAMRLKQLSDDMFKYSLAFGDEAERIGLERYDAYMLTEQMLSEHVLLLKESGYDVILDIDYSAIPANAEVMTDAQNLMRIIDNIFSNLHKYADRGDPITVKVFVKDEENITIEFINTVGVRDQVTESNGIGMKTCSRLAKFITSGFEYGQRGNKFITTIDLGYTTDKKDGI